MGKIKYYYNGKPLVEYAEVLGISKTALNARVLRCNSDPINKGLSPEEIARKVVEEVSAFKYSVNGVSLHNYCLKNGLNYMTILSRINALKSSMEYANCSQQELVNFAISKDYQLCNRKYSYKGLNLKEYCDAHNLCYDRILRRIQRLKKDSKYNDLTNNEFVEMAITTKAHRDITYKGRKLSEYCKENDLDYSRIIAKLAYLKGGNKYANHDDDDLLKMIIDKTYSNSKYSYQGMSFSKYCQLHDISYHTMMKKIENLRNNEFFKDKTDNELIKFLMEEDSAIVALYSHQRVAGILKENTFDMNKLEKLVREFKAKNTDEDKTDYLIILDAMKEYTYSIRYDKMINSLDKEDLTNRDVKEIILFLKLDTAFVSKIQKVTGIKRAILMNHYFGEEARYGKRVSMFELRRIEELVKRKNIENIELCDLIKLYKSELRNTTREILLIKENDIKQFINELVDEGILRENLIEDAISEYRYYVLDTLKENIANVDRIMEKLDDKDFVLKYIKKENDYQSSLVYTGGNDCLLTRIMPNSEFSSNVRDWLDCLSEIERKYIYDRYQNEYDYSDLVRLYKMDIQEIEEFEKNILYKLSQRANLTRKK